MASRKDTIMKAAKRTAKQAQEAASRRSPNTRRGVNTDSHRHCVVCWKPIPLESDPAICHEEGCGEIQERRERSRRRWTFLMYFGIAIFVAMLAFQIAI